MIFLTGATGFIGQRVLQALANGGRDVTVLGRRPVIHPQVRFREVDLLSGFPPAMLDGAEGATLVHLAWYAAPGKFWTAPENLDWLAASLRLVRAFAQAGGRRLVGAGTCAEYDWSGSQPLDEAASPLRPATLYGTAKTSLFRMLEAAAPLLELDWAWARIFNPYGPGEARQRLLGSLIASVQERRGAIFSAGTQKRDFMHVEDIAAAIVAVAESAVSGPVNVASGESRTVREFVEMAASAARATGAEVKVRFGGRPLAPQDVPIVAAHTRRLEELGFKSRFGFEDGIADAVRRGLPAAPAQD